MTKQRVIIFDSPDGTGKTNIAQALSRDFGIPYFRMDSQHDNWRAGRFKEALEFDQTYISSFLKQTRQSVIIDRAYPSEWVYSKVYNRETNEDVLRNVDLAFKEVGTTIIIPLRRSYENSREDEVVSPEKLIPLHDKYVEFCSWTCNRTMQIYVDDFYNMVEYQIPPIREQLLLTHPPLHVVLGKL